MIAEEKYQHPVTGFLVVPKVAATVNFVQSVFGGEEQQRYQAPNGKTWYSVMQVGGVPVSLMEQFPSMGLYAPNYRPAAGGDTAMLAMAVKNVDATFKKAIQEGAIPILEPHDAYWGDRYAEFRDKAGVRYALADTSCGSTAVTGSEDNVSELTPDQVKEKFDKFQKDHNFPSNPAKIVGVNEAAIINAMPSIRLAFEPNDASLTSESKTELAFVADYLKENPDKKIVVVGHADSVGAPEEELMKLSVKRAEVVARELTEHHGINPARLKPQGAGALSPVASNSTREGRALNRRVVFVDA
jgi:outer membrane protein OmpA-like peptidoglycan-associated protein